MKNEMKRYLNSVFFIKSERNRKSISIKIISFLKNVAVVMVSIVAFQAVDPGSILGR
jgi:hypothetical protein